MNIQSYILLAVVLSAFIAAVVFTVKNRHKNKCSGCTGCCSTCSGCTAKKK